MRSTSDMVTMPSSLECDGYTVSWASGVTGLEILQDAYQELVQSMPDATLFISWEWLSCSAHVLDNGRTLRVVCVWKDTKLVACAPLTWGLESINGVSVRSIRRLGDPLADRVPFVVSPENPHAYGVLLDAIVQQSHAWDVMLLSELPHRPWERQLIQQWSVQRQVRTHWRHSTRSPIVSLAGRNAAVLQQEYPKSLAVRLRRSRKKLATAGTVRFRRWQPAPEEVDQVLNICKAVEDASWKGTDGVGIFSSETRMKFFQALSRKLAANKWLDIGYLCLDERVISYRYGFRYKDVYLDYNLAFDPGYMALSPGRILLDDMIVSSAELGLRAVDASHGGVDSPHQLAEWTSDYLDHFQLWVFNRTLSGHYLYVMRECVRPGVRWIRSRLREEGKPAHE